MRTPALHAIQHMCACSVESHNDIARQSRRCASIMYTCTFACTKLAPVMQLSTVISRESHSIELAIPIDTESRRIYTCGRRRAKMNCDRTSDTLVSGNSSTILAGDKSLLFVDEISHTSGNYFDETLLHQESEANNERATSSTSFLIELNESSSSLIFGNQQLPARQ